MVANNGAPLPNGFPDDAARLAQLMRRDPNVQIAFLALGGWDTHVNQGGAKGQLANRLQPLGQGLAELATRLGPTFDDTTILVISEFGRTVRQNGTGGTDHGHGNVMWALGGNVAGGKVLRPLAGHRRVVAQRGPRPRGHHRLPPGARGRLRAQPRAAGQQARPRCSRASTRRR